GVFHVEAPEIVAVVICHRIETASLERRLDFVGVPPVDAPAEAVPQRPAVRHAVHSWSGARGHVARVGGTSSAAATTSGAVGTTSPCSATTSTAGAVAGRAATA